MKIIKQPNIGNWSINYQCVKCEAELQVEIEDLTYYKCYYDNHNYYDRYICKCVICQTDMVFNGRDIPTSIQKILKNK